MQSLQCICRHGSNLYVGVGLWMWTDGLRGILQKWQAVQVLFARHQLLLTEQVKYRKPLRWYIETNSDMYCQKASAMHAG